MFRVIACFSIASTIWLPGCTSKVCTAIGCADAFEVKFTGATGKPGRYQVNVVVDGVPSKCEMTLPSACDIEPVCSRTDLSWRLTLSACALGADRETLDGIVFYGQAPLTLELVIRRDDMVVGEGSVRPDYKESRPNGPDCEPVCRSAPRFETAIAP